MSRVSEKFGTAFPNVLSKEIKKEKCTKTKRGKQHKNCFDDRALKAASWKREGGKKQQDTQNDKIAKRNKGATGGERERE